MASPDERQSRTIHTAACLIIGDEVLGGKVRDPLGYLASGWSSDTQSLQRLLTQDIDGRCRTSLERLIFHKRAEIDTLMN